MSRQLIAHEHHRLIRISPSALGHFNRNPWTSHLRISRVGSRWEKFRERPRPRRPHLDQGLHSMLWVQGFRLESIFYPSCAHPALLPGPVVPCCFVRLQHKVLIWRQPPPFVAVGLGAALWQKSFKAPACMPRAVLLPILPEMVEGESEPCTPIESVGSGHYQ